MDFVLEYMHEAGAWGMYWRIGLIMAAISGWFVGSRFSWWMHKANDNDDAETFAIVAAISIPGIAWLCWPIWMPMMAGHVFTGEKLRRISDAEERLS